MSYPKSLLAGRTPAQYEFDLAVKGWAFTDAARLRRALPDYERLARNLEPDDRRQELMETIRGAAEGIAL